MPECDEINEDNHKLEFNQQWLNWAIPLDTIENNNHKVDNCVRYAPSMRTNRTRHCAAESFDPMQTIECTEYVHASDERNIQTEVFIRFFLNENSSIHSFKFSRSSRIGIGFCFSFM